MSDNRTTTEAFEMLKQYLILNHNAKPASGGREVIKKCHICGDSSDPTHMHMYIGQRDGVIVYNCFKCNSKGVVDARFLRDIGCYDDNLIILISEQNSKGTNSKPIKAGNYRNVFRRKEVNILYPRSSDNKLQYICDRIGVPIDQFNPYSFKVIPNIKSFLSDNGITRYTRDERVLDVLDEHYVGFLSIDNSYIILRKVSDPSIILPNEANTRYVVYNIFEGNKGSKIYGIPGHIDTLRDVNICIAEGVFDIMSVYFNTRISAERDKTFFIAISGNSYLRAIMDLILRYGLIGSTIHVYIDNDVDMNKLRKNIYYAPGFRELFKGAFIHMNQFSGEKDFGVPKDRIDERITQIF